MNGVSASDNILQCLENKVNALRCDKHAFDAHGASSESGCYLFIERPQVHVSRLRLREGGTNRRVIRKPIIIMQQEIILPPGTYVFTLWL